MFWPGPIHLRNSLRTSDMDWVYALRDEDGVRTRHMRTHPILMAAYIKKTYMCYHDESRDATRRDATRRDATRRDATRRDATRSDATRRDATRRECNKQTMETKTSTSKQSCFFSIIHLFLKCFAIILMCSNTYGFSRFGMSTCTQQHIASL